MSKQNNSLAPIISTIVVAILAIAVAIFAIVLISGEDNNSSVNTPADNGSSNVSEAFTPTQELVEECTYAAHDLVAANYKVVRLYITEGLAHLDEPYGNLPEDGYYTVNSNAYKTLDDISSLLNSVYTPDEAMRILTDIDGNGMQVYRNREKLVKVEETYEGSAEATEEASTSESSVQYGKKYVLGISADFAPDADYTKDWSSCRIAVTPISETECRLVVYLDGLTPETATEADADSVLETSMFKVGGSWKLTSFAY